VIHTHTHTHTHTQCGFGDEISTSERLDPRWQEVARQEESALQEGDDREEKDGEQDCSEEADYVPGAGASLPQAKEVQISVRKVPSGSHVVFSEPRKSLNRFCTSQAGR